MARALAGVFARMPGARDRGMRREGNQVFTHENVCFPNVYAQGEGRVIHGPVTPHTMITTSVRGHLATIDFPQNYGWSKCAPIELLGNAPIETTYKQDMEPLERMLRQLASRCQVVILWLDCDREGEAIADEVRTVCLKGNPRLTMFRARFSTVLAPEIQRALKSLGRLNENFVAAVQARSELDLRVGAAFTRFQTLRLQRKFDGFSEQGVVSYGPCQFPTLGFVVERYVQYVLLSKIQTLTLCSHLTLCYVIAHAVDGPELRRLFQKTFGTWNSVSARILQRPKNNHKTVIILLHQRPVQTIVTPERFTLRGNAVVCMIECPRWCSTKCAWMLEKLS